MRWKRETVNLELDGEDEKRLLKKVSQHIKSLGYELYDFGFYESKDLPFGLHISMNILPIPGSVSISFGLTRNHSASSSEITSLDFHVLKAAIDNFHWLNQRAKEAE